MSWQVPIPPRHGIPNRLNVPGTSKAHELKNADFILHSETGGDFEANLDEDIFYGVPEQVDDDLFADLKVSAPHPLLTDRINCALTPCVTVVLTVCGVTGR